MSKRGLGDTFYVSFLTESIEKERDTRLALFKDLQQRPAVGSRVSEVMRRRIADGTPKPIGELLEVKDMPSADYRRKKKTFLPVQPRKEQSPLQLERAKTDFQQSKGLANVAKLPPMWPASAGVKQRLYEGLSHHGQGRQRYLHERYIEDPEQKFPLPVLNSWDYGWRFSDVIDPQTIKKSPHIRIRTVDDTFYRRNGVTGMAVSACY